MSKIEDNHLREVKGHDDKGQPIVATHSTIRHEYED